MLLVAFLSQQCDVYCESPRYRMGETTQACLHCLDTNGLLEAVPAIARLDSDSTWTVAVLRPRDAKPANEESVVLTSGEEDIPDKTSSEITEVGQRTEYGWTERDFETNATCHFYRWNAERKNIRDQKDDLIIQKICQGLHPTVYFLGRVLSPISCQDFTVIDTKPQALWELREEKSLGGIRRGPPGANSLIHWRQVADELRGAVVFQTKDRKLKRRHFRWKAGYTPWLNFDVVNVVPPSGHWTQPPRETPKFDNLSKSRFFIPWTPPSPNFSFLECATEVETAKAYRRSWDLYQMLREHTNVCKYRLTTSDCRH